MPDKMMFSLVVSLSLMSGMATAIVCTPALCEGTTQPELDCKGGIIKAGGFCGCTDACAKVEGETCQAEYMRGFIPQGACDEGLMCVKEDSMAFGVGHCVRSQPANLQVSNDLLASKRADGTTQTICEQRRRTSMISMVVYEGQWFPKCDTEGNFLSMQCDNTKHCFCVDILTGVVLEGTKVLGDAKC